MFSRSQGHPSKPENGDHEGHVVLPGTDILVLVVSDGVSSHDYDYKASATTCAACIQSLSESKGAIPKRLKQAVDSAHDAVQSLRGPAQGAMATLLLASYNNATGKCHFLSIGDSRIYKVRAQGVDILTEDDSRAVVIKQDGKTVLQNGAVVFRHALTQAIGQANPLEVKVQSTNLQPGEMLSLATDGCHEIPGFSGRLESVQGYADLETGAQTLVMDHHLENGTDDGTLALVRRVDCSGDLSEIYFETFNDDISLNDSELIGHTMLRIIMGKMIEWASVPDSENLERGLAYIRKEKLIPGRKSALAILDEFKSDDSPEALLVYRKIVAWAGCL